MFVHLTATISLPVIPGVFVENRQQSNIPAYFFRLINMPSSVVADISYDPRKRNLRIHFVSGSVYEYLDVPEQVVSSMRHSDSKGAFLNRYIKGHYKYKKLDP